MPKGKHEQRACEGLLSTSCNKRIHQQYQKCCITVNFKGMNIVFPFFCEIFYFIDTSGGPLWKQPRVDLFDAILAILNRGYF